MTAADNFSKFTALLDDPYSNSFDITPTANVANTFAYVTRAIYVGGAGSVVALLANDGASRSFANVPAGTTLKVRAVHVSNTSTATGLVGLY